jgi:acylphosphatase
MRVVRIAVRGRVQGVGFRDWVMRRARALELAGWVRNRSDGSVEIFAAGEAQPSNAWWRPLAAARPFPG